MPADRLIIGCDESGTGSIAGPATVTAFMTRASQIDRLRELGAMDSKAFGGPNGDARRRAVMAKLKPAAVHVKTVELSAVALSKDQRQAWREGMAQAVKSCFEVTGWFAEEIDLIIDGNVDQKLYDYFARLWKCTPVFKPKADVTEPAVGAASIFAKTLRNDRMLELHAKHPNYAWDHNYGYGTDDHFMGICVYGCTAQHRKVEPLKLYFEEIDALVRSENAPDRDLHLPGLGGQPQRAPFVGIRRPQAAKK
jgi:ribonuclease HII